MYPYQIQPFTFDMLGTIISLKLVNFQSVNKNKYVNATMPTFFKYVPRDFIYD